MLKFLYGAVRSTRRYSFFITRFSSKHKTCVEFRTSFHRRSMDLACVINIFEELVPPQLSETWDNTGLLVEPTNVRVTDVLFTNDLTENVLKEAISKKVNLIISYHPPIFTPIKSLTCSNWKNRILIKCIENSIAVYSPHTACDAVKGGVNDWLISCFDLTEVHPIQQSYVPQSKYSHHLDFCVPRNMDTSFLMESLSDVEVTVMSCNEKNQYLRMMLNKNSITKAMTVLASNEEASSITLSALSPLPLSLCGPGRIGKLQKSMKIKDCITTVKRFLNLNNIRFSFGLAHTLDTEISVIAVCAGSGSSVLKGVVADLYITGEMSHHDLLDANHRKTSVILCEHSNSERGYLTNLMKNLAPKLSDVNLIMSFHDKDPVTIL